MLPRTFHCSDLSSFDQCTDVGFSDKLSLLAIVSSEFKSSASEKTPFPLCLWQFFNSTRMVLRFSEQLAKEQKSHSNLTFRLRSHYTDESSTGWKIWPNTSFTTDRSKYFRYVHMEFWTARRLYFLTAKAVLHERISYTQRSFSRSKICSAVPG